MKKCPFCAEDIQDAAIKCRHCGSMLGQPATLADQVTQPTTAPTSVPRDEFEDVRELALRGKKISAIKLLREKTGWGLKQAKDFVESRAFGVPSAKTKNQTGTLVFVICVLVGAIYFSKVGIDSWLNLPTTQSPAAPVSNTPTIQPNAIDISADDLVQAYKDNEVAADQRFKGTTLLVSGIIETIGKDVLNTPYVTFRSSGFRHVQAMFAPSDEGLLAALSKGSPVSIQGRCNGMFGNILIKDAVLR